MNIFYVAISIIIVIVIAFVCFVLKHIWSKKFDNSYDYIGICPRCKGWFYGQQGERHIFWWCRESCGYIRIDEKVIETGD